MRNSLVLRVRRSWVWKHLRITVALLLPLTSIPAWAREPRGVELDLGVGVSAVDTVSKSAVAPVVSVRAAVDVRNYCTFGIRGLGVLGGEPQRGGSNYQAWALLPELRLHSPKLPVQVFFDLGIGLGQLQHADGGVREITSLRGDPGVFLEAGLGMRAIVGPVTLTAEALAMLFTQVMGGNGTYIRPPTPEQEAQKTSVLAAMLQFSIGWRGVH